MAERKKDLLPDGSGNDEFEICRIYDASRRCVVCSLPPRKMREREKELAELLPLCEPDSEWRILWNEKQKPYIHDLNAGKWFYFIECVLKDDPCEKVKNKSADPRDFVLAIAFSLIIASAIAFAICAAISTI